MSEETTQVHSTSQEAESTQPDVTELPESSTGETGETLTTEEQAAKEEGKDPNGWALKRISELTRARHEAERAADAKVQSAQGEAARYRLLVEQMQRGEKPDTVTVTGTPAEQPNIDELVSKRAAEIAQQTAMAERGQSVSKVGAEAYPDFMTAVSTLDALGISGDQVQSLLGMDDAHNVIYKLGKNPEEAARILSLPPIQQGRELERLASKPNPVPPAKAVSKAPAPIATVEGISSGDADQSKMSMTEWAAWRAKSAKTRF